MTIMERIMATDIINMDTSHSLSHYLCKVTQKWLQEVGGGHGDWMELAQDRDRWWALVRVR
jgi:hypothetical protein